MENRPRVLVALRRPVGRGTVLLLAFVACAAPAWLYYAPTGRIARDPLAVYRLYSDDFAYIAAARNLPRTLTNLFVPHNTHIVPAWRLLTWGLVAWTGNLAALPRVFAVASYAILVAVVLLAGRLVVRETGRVGLSLAAMTLLGTSSLLASAATWYSASQALWAGFGILATLWYAQGWRRAGGLHRLALAGLSAATAGWFWTVGHVAGPVAAVYLWADGRPRCRKAAAVPLLATASAVALALALGGSRMAAKVSFHGRGATQAMDVKQGVLHTGQAVIESLVLGPFGLQAETTVEQGAALTCTLLAAWAATRRAGWRFNPLEGAGAALVLGSYLVEWTFRGYLPFSSLRGVVPWYDTIPQIGAVLFVSGWWAGPREPGAGPPRRVPLTRAGALGVVLLAAALVVAQRTSVEGYWQGRVPPLTPAEAERFRIPSLRVLRSSYLTLERARWQRRHLVRLEGAERSARRLGIGREAIRRAFGRVDAPELPHDYDAADMLNLPWAGREDDPRRIRAALGAFFVMEPEPQLSEGMLRAALPPQ